MSRISKQQLKRISSNFSAYPETVRKSLSERASLQRNDYKQYDIFLSHSFLDAEIIFGLAKLLEEAGFLVFVDWIEAPGLDRTKVVPETAEYLRQAMKRSASLLYAVSDNASSSKWMPWELGYSDGLHSRVAIAPISDFENAADSYQGQEYLGLYPYVTADNFQYAKNQVYVRKSGGTMVGTLKDWLKSRL